MFKMFSTTHIWVVRHQTVNLLRNSGVDTPLPKWLTLPGGRNVLNKVTA